MISSAFADHTPSQERKQIFVWLDVYTRSSESSLDVCIELLDSVEDVPVQAFAARMVHDKIKFSWETISEDKRSDLIQALFFFLRKFSGSERALLSNIVVCLVQIAIYTAPHQWSSVISDFISFAEVSVEEQIDTRFASIYALTLLLEDIPKSYQIDENHRNQLILYVQNHEEVILNVLSQVLINESDMKLQEQVLKCLSAWEYKNENLLRASVIFSVFKIVDSNQYLIDDCGDFLISLMENPYTPIELKIAVFDHCCDLKDLYISYFSQGSQQIDLKIEDSIEAGNNLASLFSTLGLFIKDVTTNLKTVMNYCDLMLECTKNPDQEIMLKVFDFWTELCLVLVDLKLEDKFIEPIGKLLLVLKETVLWPVSEVEQWIPSVLSEYMVFRREAAEIASCCFDILHDTANKVLVDSIKNDLQTDVFL
eukprot:TRINITY_DN3593_c0_g1_i1.p1 TRINITY_DN3593_c0_g1~~TRINITY_DN3593_c0_g1_i1.p1  ORF type:complete len:425 (-),score=68.39 TRINITY_DN3593_c0_g1_i1:1865-3139(-)